MRINENVKELIQNEIDGIKEEAAAIKGSRHFAPTTILFIVWIAHLFAFPYWNNFPFEPATAWTLTFVALSFVYLYFFVQLLEETGWIKY